MRHWNKFNNMDYEKIRKQIVEYQAAIIEHQFIEVKASL